MERNLLTCDVPTVGNLPFRITNFRMHPESKQQLEISLPQGFVGLFLNLGVGFNYSGLAIAPGAFDHNQYNFVYVPAGDYSITLDAGLHHSIAVELPSDETHRWIKDIPPLEDFLRRLGPDKSLFLTQEHSNFSARLQTELDQFLYNIWKDDYLGKVYMAVMTFNIFLHCISEITNITLIPKSVTNGSEHKTIIAAAKFLVDNIGQNISVEELADHFNISQRNLQRGFNEQYGETVHEYILRYRMDQAKVLLADRTKSIKNIASSLGYKYVENFTTAYKKRFNQSPRDTRSY